MTPHSGYRQAMLTEDGELVRHRGRGDLGRSTVLVASTALDHPNMAALGRLEREYALKDQLDRAWAVRPLEIVEQAGRRMLLLEDPGGELLARSLGAPLPIGRFLQLAAAIAGALAKAHRRGLVHRDLNPAHILVDCADGGVRLTGFGRASQLPRERPQLQPPETIAGSLAYMAPEQTGRMNRSVDSRSDLYALGVIFYEMLAGVLPLTASEPAEWAHRHITRRPEPVSTKRPETPAMVSAIVMKLLAKTAEDRYQTAAGLEHDLRRCLGEWEAEGRIADFPLGEHDTPDRLVIPERLYGRERDVARLLAVFDRLVSDGATEVVLVSGHSGIGKSSLINELHKALAPAGGLFAAGKFEQFKRDIPYATLAQALQGLVRSLLGKSDADLAAWREAICEALGPNGQLMADLIPELTLVIGLPPPPSEVTPQQAQSRFQLVFRRFIGVFARPEHPLVLVLDDLQWIDAATLDLLTDLLPRPDAGHLMLVGAYRDNEVGPDHPLTRRIEAGRADNARLEEIRLRPLTPRDLAQLVADALHCTPDHAAALAGLVHDKTGGNAFFAIQFLRALADEGLLWFDDGEGAWSWDLDRIRAKGYTDNVVDLMLGRLNRLPAKSKQALQQFACIGDRADTAELTAVLGISEAAAHARLWPAVREELIVRQAGGYRFAHDRIQEAAYALVPAGLRAEAHLRIGRLLAARTPPERREEAIFEIVNQLNRGVGLITDPAEREELAEFDLIAGKRARASTAYAAALAYLTAGAALLPQDRWERRRELAFALELNRAECLFLTGDLAGADTGLTDLAAHAADIVERAEVARRHMYVFMTMNQSSHAIAVALGFLAQAGVDWSPHPTAAEARHEYAKIGRRLGGRSVEQLVDLPPMSNPDALAMMEVLTELHMPGLFTDWHLAALAICRAVNLSLEHGNSDASGFAYVALGAIAGTLFGDYQLGFRFGRLGYELNEQRGLTHFYAHSCLLFAAFVMPWTKPVRTCRDVFEQAIEASNRIGDLQYVAHTRMGLNTNLLFAGDPLPETQVAVERGVALALSGHFGPVVDLNATHLALIRTLRGLTPQFGRFDDGQIGEEALERRLASGPPHIARCWWVRKLQGRFLAGDHQAALEAALRVQSLPRSSEFFLEDAEYHFYGALAHAAACEGAQGGERRDSLDAIAAHQKRLTFWAENCPENFADRAALVGAEIARLEGRELDAQRLYEEAIRSARANGFVHNEAIACELAANFYAARGFEAIANLYRRHARDGYLRWGADGKVRQLDERYPELRQTESASGRLAAIDAPVERLDLATVLKVSQAVSGEIVLDKLIDTLLRTAIEHAGAERGVLVLTSGGAPRIVAEAVTQGDLVQVDLSEVPLAAGALPQSIVNWAWRTREAVILDDAAAPSAFAADPYLQQTQTRSVLCLPLIKQGTVMGALYLENRSTTRAFAPGGVAVLKLTASQAAIALENSLLYRDLADREARIRRLVDANIIGIMIWDFEGRISEANDAFLQIVGYDRADVAAGRIRWTDLTPPEWLDIDTTRWVPDLKQSGSLQPFEKEYIRKDGNRVPVLIGVAMLEGSANQGIAFVLDLTERKEAEERQKLLLDELNHRVKNTLATVLAISAQTFQAAESPAEFRTAFEGRVMALSRTHNIANRNYWQAVGLRELLSQVLEPFLGVDTARCELIGEEVRLMPEMGVSLGLAFHELATNAAKYGALSTPAGRIRVSWRPESKSHLWLEWREMGGPCVQPPTRRGFGSRLLERALPRQISGPVDLEFRPEGVRCTLHMAVGLLAEPAAADAPARAAAGISTPD